MTQCASRWLEDFECPYLLEHPEANFGAFALIHRVEVDAGSPAK